MRPPGPWNLPLIGSLLHFVKSHPPAALQDLANKYGPVMFLRMGEIDTVVISSPAAAEEVLREKDIIFASRPSTLISEFFCYQSFDVVFSPYGAYLRTLRKLCTVELFSAKMVRQFAPIRDNETMSLIKNIQAAGRGGEPIHLARHLLSCSNSITAKAAFGQVCNSELRDQFLSSMAVAINFTGGFTFGDVFPSLRFIDIIIGLR
jgi:cytochrome P450